MISIHHLIGHAATRLKLSTLLPTVLPVACLLSAALAHSHGTTAAPDPAASARQIQFPDTAEYQTLVVDLHTHSVFSDGHVWPKIRVEEARRDGLDALAITEHLEYQPHLADIPHTDRNRAIESAQEAAEGSNLLIIAGSEITREAPAGHINAVFIKDANALLQVEAPPEDPADTRGYYIAANQWPAQQAVEAASQQGAFIFWNHPYWTRQNPDGIARINDFHRNNAKRGHLHGIEIANGQTYSEEAFAIALKHKLAIIGVSDVHDLIDWDHPPSAGEHRPVTLVFATERSQDAIKEALFERRTVVWFRNLLIGREAQLMPLLQASLSVTAASYRPGTQVLDISVVNTSDAEFQLRNQSDMTFMESADLIQLKPHSVTQLTVKTGKQLNKVSLPFVVENALVAPKTHPRYVLQATVQ